MTNKTLEEITAKISESLSTIEESREFEDYEISYLDGYIFISGSIHITSKEVYQETYLQPAEYDGDRCIELHEVVITDKEGEEYVCTGKNIVALRCALANER